MSQLDDAQSLNGMQVRFVDEVNSLLSNIPADQRGAVIDAVRDIYLKGRSKPKSLAK